jgi:hypothetical protein
MRQVFGTFPWILAMFIELVRGGYYQTRNAYGETYIHLTLDDEQKLSLVPVPPQLLEQKAATHNAFLQLGE